MDITTIQSGQIMTDQSDANAKVSSVSADQEVLGRAKNASGNSQGEAALFDINEVLAKDAQARQENADKSETGGKDLPQAVEEVESFFRAQNRNLTFAVDEDTQRSVVTVKDSESGDVIRQIPSEEILQLAERIKAFQEDIDSRVGVFVNRQV